jgi:hypothetical protein
VCVTPQYKCCYDAVLLHHSFAQCPFIPFVLVCSAQQSLLTLGSLSVSALLQELTAITKTCSASVANLCMHNVLPEPSTINAQEPWSCALTEHHLHIIVANHSTDLCNDSCLIVKILMWARFPASTEHSLSQHWEICEEDGRKTQALGDCMYRADQGSGSLLSGPVWSG